MLKVLGIQNNTFNDLYTLFKKYGDLQIKMHKTYAVLKYRDARSIFIAQQKLNKSKLNNATLEIVRYSKQLQQIQDQQERQILQKEEQLKNQKNKITEKKMINQSIQNDLVSIEQKQEVKSEGFVDEQFFEQTENIQVYKSICNSCNQRIQKVFSQYLQIVQREKKNSIKELLKQKIRILKNYKDDKLKLHQLENLKNSLHKQLNKTEVQLDLTISRISKQLKQISKKQVNLQYQPIRQKTSKQNFNEVKSFQQEIQFQNPMNNQVRKLLPISDTEFIAALQSKEVKFFSKNDYMHKDKISYERSPYSLCLYKNEILVGQKSRISLIKNTNPPTKQFFTFSVTQINQPIVEIKQHSQDTFICATRNGYISKFRITQQQILSNENSIIFNQICNSYGQGYVYSMDILDKSCIALGQDLKLHLMDLQRRQSQTRFLKKRINKVMSWGNNFVACANENFINIVDRRTKKDLLLFDINEAYEIISLQKLSEYKMAYGANAILGLVDTRMGKGPYFSNRSVHKNYIKDIICLKDNLITGGLDSKIVSWKII